MMELGLVQTRAEDIKQVAFVTREEALKALDDLFVQAADAPDMTLEEINAEIAEARAARRKTTVFAE